MHTFHTENLIRIQSCPCGVYKWRHYWTSTWRLQSFDKTPPVNISDQTVRRRFVSTGLTARITRKRPYLNVCYIRRRPGEDNIPECTTATMKHPVSVMIWGCMVMIGVGWIQVVRGTINAVNYISSILQPKMLPSARDLFGSGNDYIFQQDGAPCHVARKVVCWQQHGGTGLAWKQSRPQSYWEPVIETEARSCSKKTKQPTVTYRSWHFILISPNNTWTSSSTSGIHAKKMSGCYR